MDIKKFRKEILRYYRENRRDFPWRSPRPIDPYRVLVSEIILQQTQTSRVALKYETFLKKFPNFRALAKARTTDVLSAWQGLGYNRRALALKRTAEIVVRDYEGKLPPNAESLVALPGIGKGTAGALLAFAFNIPNVFIETNIRRVFLHFFFSTRGVVKDIALLPYLESSLDRKNPREWYYALMDYGAMLGTSARGITNPNRRSAAYRTQAKFKGSNRELRGKILKELLKGRQVSVPILSRTLKEPRERVTQTVHTLTKEGFVKIIQGKVMLSE